MDRRYQIFISSTYADLKEERDKVMRAVLQLKCFPAGMELFPAVDKNQFDYIKSEIDECDYYLLIIGARYGSMDKDGVSYTEKEYNYAVRKKIPVIAFLHNDIKSIPLGKADAEKELQDKLEKFRKKVQKGRLVNYWTNPDDLKAKVISSLPMAFTIQPRTGWVRADEVTNEALQEAFEDIKKEIGNLKAANQGIGSKKEFDLTDWDKEFTITFEENDNSWSSEKDQKIKESFCKKKSWKNWFMVIATAIDNDRFTPLDSMFSLISELSSAPNGYYPKTHDLELIRYKFIAEGLITETSRNRDVWNLTTKGKILLAKTMSDGI